MTLASDRPAVVWFRRDLRLHDHPALAAALAAHPAVVPLFVVDETLVRGRWPAPNRLWWMLASVEVLAASIAARGGRLVVRVGRPEEIVPAVASAAGARDVHVSRDHAPYGMARDRRVAERLRAIGAALHEAPGVLIQEPEDVHTADGRPPVVFAAFLRAWERLPVRAPMPVPSLVPWPAGLDPGAVGAASDGRTVPAREDLGLRAPTADPSLLPAPGEEAARSRLARWLDPGGDRLDGYALRRDRLDVEGSSRLSADLRWGTLSPTEVLVASRRPGDGSRAFARELAWRDFYAHQLRHRPALRASAFRSALDAVPWRHAEEDVAAWRDGRTGYPAVDAAMRQLHATGWLPNRARMIVASFLAKHLLVDWRVGERHFMEHLVDGDIASNNGGWQWVAGTGPDAQPYFRILDPVAQGRRHDHGGGYVRRWLPELRDVPAERIHAPWLMSADEQASARCRIGVDYPAPVVEHRFARARALDAYAAAARRAPVSAHRPRPGAIP